MGAGGGAACPMGVPRTSLLPAARVAWPVCVARLLAMLLIASPPGSAAESVRCAEARQALGARGFSLAGVPHHHIDGTCGGTLTEKMAKYVL